MWRRLQEKQLRASAEQYGLKLTFFCRQWFFQELAEHRFDFPASAQNRCCNGPRKRPVAGRQFCSICGALKGVVKGTALIEHSKECGCRQMASRQPIRWNGCLARARLPLMA